MSFLDENLRVLHAAQMRTQAIGIARQMLEEQCVADGLGIPWSSRLFVPKGSAVNATCVESTADIREKWAFKRSFFYWLKSVSDQYDVILLRHSVYSPGEVEFLRSINKPVYLVHHTLEEPELSSSRGFLGKTLALSEKYFGRLSIRLSKGIVAVTDEIGAYEAKRAGRKMPVHIYPNGLIIERNDEVRDERDGNVPQLLFVASNFVPWHGLDILINAVESSREDFRIHLVGQLTEDQYNKVNSDPRFVVHGLMNSDQIKSISARCWVGLASFALFRKRMYQACTLKVREYLAGGLPVFSGHVDIFPSSFKFFIKGDADIGQILNYAYKMKACSRDEVIKAALPYIDKAELLRSLYKNISSEVSIK